MSRRLVLVLMLVGLMGGAVLPALAEAGAAKPGGTLKFALLRDPTRWNPHITQGATTYTFMANI